jgi:hypothetical protein
MMSFPAIDQVLLPYCNTPCSSKFVACIHLLQNIIKKPNLQKHHAYIGFSAIILIRSSDAKMDVAIVIVAQNQLRMIVKSSQMDKVTFKPLMGSLPRKVCLQPTLNALCQHDIISMHSQLLMSSIQMMMSVVRSC